MEQAGTSSGEVFDRPQSRHAVAGGLALVLSLILHVFLIRSFPDVPVGRPPDLSRVERIRSIRMSEVHREALPAVERPQLYRPENPEQYVDMAPDRQVFAEALDQVVPPEPELPPSELAGETESVLEPQAAATPQDWEPRQDILKIEEQLYAEAVSSLPRYSIPDVPRVDRAPDITLPIDLLEVRSEPSAKPRTAAGESFSPASLADLASLTGRSGSGVPGPLGTGSLPDEMGLLDERAGEVSDLEPVEQLLRLKVYTDAPAADDHIYFELHILPFEAGSLPVLPKDVLFIQDCSESMTQSKLDECKAGLKEWIERLDRRDRFDLMGFREEAYRCFEEWKPVTPAAKASANWFIERMEARGKTDVLKSLQALSNVTADSGRPVLALLVTDGRPTRGIVDSSDIIEAFSRENQAAISVFAFGGGRRVNRYLLDFLSYKNRGDSRVEGSRYDIPEALRDWAVELNRPVLSDLRYRFAGLDEDAIYPKTLTHLFLDRPLVIYGRVPRQAPVVAFQIVGQSGAAKHDMVFKIDWNHTEQGRADLRLQWAWHKVYHLIGQHIETGSPEVLTQIRALGRRFNLAIPYEEELPIDL